MRKSFWLRVYDVYMPTLYILAWVAFGISALAQGSTVFYVIEAISGLVLAALTWFNVKYKDW